MLENYILEFQNFFHVQPIDRTNTLKDIKSTYNKIFLDLNYKTDLDLKTIINNRTILLSKYDNLILFWSGGIDSTLVFYSLIEHNVNFDIMLSKNSELEYPLLFNKIINKDFVNIKNIFYLENFDKENVKDKTIVTGEIGDQIMGSMKYLDYSIEDLKEPYKKYIPENILVYYDDVCQLVLKDQNANLSEYLWSLNFIFKYEDVIIRFPRVLKNLNLDDNNTLLAHFFNTKDFQAWSIQNYKKHCNFDKIQDYKKEYKQYIFDINGDKDYYENKIKVPSLDSSIIAVS